MLTLPAIDPSDKRRLYKFDRNALSAAIELDFGVFGADLRDPNEGTFSQAE